MNKKLILCFFVSLPFFVRSAYADDYTVDSPSIEKGELSLESNINYSIDDRSQYNRYLSHVDGIGYGVTDWWETEISAEVEKESSADMRITHLKWGNMFVPFKSGENWVDFGFNIQLKKALQEGDPNNIEGKILLEKSFGNFTHTANIIVGHDFGSHSNTGFDTGFSWRTSYHINDNFEPGVEYYSDVGKLNHIEDFSDQDNVAGPVLRGTFGPVSYDTGILEGVSRAAHETTFKLNLEFDF